MSVNNGTQTFVSTDLYKDAPEIFPIEEISAQEYTPRWQPQVIRRMFCKCFTDQNRNLPEPLNPKTHDLYDGFKITQNNFKEWLHVWRMDISETNPNNKDLFRFARENKEKFTDLVEQEILKLKNVKVSFALGVKFSIILKTTNRTFSTGMIRKR